jgi:hypothetical protein
MIEGAALAVGRGKCPLGPLQAKLGDPVPLFELVLPPRGAKAAVPVLAAASVAGIALVPYARRPRILSERIGMVMTNGSCDAPRGARTWRSGKADRS